MLFDEKYQLEIRYVGDAQFGTDNMRSYRAIISGQQGQLDAFVHAISEENGIEFRDVGSATNKISEELSGWKKVTLRKGGDDDREWRAFATKVANGNKELENTFHIAISAAEDNWQLTPDHKTTGVYTSDHFKVEVDLYKEIYKITNL